MFTELITDDLGMIWIFDGERVKVTGDGDENGGYPATSFYDAINILESGGYLSAPIE